MKQLLFFGLLLLSGQLVNAQAKTVSTHSITYISFIGLGYNYEHAMSSKLTLVGHANLSSSFLSWNQSNGISYSISPQIGLEPRFYYNLNRRFLKNKVTEKNSADFLAIRFEYLFKPVLFKDPDELSGISISPMWGYRRVSNKLWVTELAGGVGCIIGSESDIYWSPRVDLKFGVIF